MTKKKKKRIDWSDSKDLWVLDISKPEDEWKFEKVVEK